MEGKQQLGQFLRRGPMEPKPNKPTLSIDIEDQNSASSSADTAADADDSYPSDCESVVSGPENPGRQIPPPAATNGLIRVGEHETIHRAIVRNLVSSLGSCGLEARVETVHRNDLSIVARRAKFQSFCLFRKATEEKRNGSANLKYGWYGASGDEIDAVISHGFGLPAVTNGAYGEGLYLSPADHPIESVRSAVADEDGVKRVLLCRVIMGKTEPVLPGSRQSNPSSEDFDSGVDDSAQPRKYVVWAPRMNTHVFPEFVVSFRASPRDSNESRRVPVRQVPRSDWMPFPDLIGVLARFLPADAIELIGKHHGDFKKRKISRLEMVALVRNVAGDNLLSAIIRAYRGKIHARENNSSFRAARGNFPKTSN